MHVEVGNPPYTSPSPAPDRRKNAAVPAPVFHHFPVERV